MRRGRIFLQHLLYRALVPLCLIPSLAAQTPLDSSPNQPGSTEWGFATGGGAQIAGGAGDGNFWAAQLRWGRVLTAPHGPGPLRGSLEYAFEVVPALVMVQSGTIFGGGFNPLVLQYNFGSGQPGLVPFLQAGGGLLFSTDDIPAGTGQFNFTPQGGVGAYWLRRNGPSLVFGLRYHHISNSGRIQPNPGHNALYFYAGFSWWR